MGVNLAGGSPLLVLADVPWITARPNKGSMNTSGGIGLILAPRLAVGISDVLALYTINDSVPGHPGPTAKASMIGSTSSNDVAGVIPSHEYLAKRARKI